MPRSIWKGSISVGGLFNFATKVYKATDSGNGLGFKEICGRCNTPLRHPKWCDKCQSEIAFAEVLKGYEIDKGSFITMTKAEIDELKPENFSRIDIQTFKRVSDFAPDNGNGLRLDGHYFITADKSDQAFSLFRELLKVTGTVAIGKIIVREREHLCLIAPFNKKLVLHTLYYADQIRSDEELPDPVDVPIKERELEIGKMIVEQLAGNNLNLDDIKDDYKAKVEQLIRDRVAGKPMPTVSEPQTVSASNLESALELTLQVLQGKSARVEALKAQT